MHTVELVIFTVTLFSLYSRLPSDRENKMLQLSNVYCNITFSADISENLIRERTAQCKT